MDQKKASKGAESLLKRQIASAQLKKNLMQTACDAATVGSFSTARLLSQFTMQSVSMHLGQVTNVDAITRPVPTLIAADSIGFISCYRDFDRETARPAPNSSSSETAASPMETNSSDSPKEKSRLSNCCMANFQSHQIEFDYLKSMEIEAKINCTANVPFYSHNSFNFLSSNDKTVKFYNVYDRNRNSDLEDLYNEPEPERKLDKRLRHKYDCHQYNINALSCSPDQMHFISSDDLNVNLWNYEYPKTAYGIVDIKPPKMEDLAQVITCAKFNPNSSKVFAYSTSKGSLHLCDERDTSYFSSTALDLFDARPRNIPFHALNEIFLNISDFAFSPCANYVATRDFLSLRVWDLRAPSEPLMTTRLLDTSKLQALIMPLYEKDILFERIQVSWLRDAATLVSGFYGNCVQVLNTKSAAGAAAEATTFEVDPTSGAVAKRDLTTTSLRFDDFDSKKAILVAGVGEDTAICAVSNQICTLKFSL